MQVKIIGRSVPLEDAIKEVVNGLGCKDYNVPETDAVISTAGRRCYNSFEPGLNPNVTKTRTDIADYIENILKSGHGSVLEHVSYTFSIEGITRVGTAELNRHRAGAAISEASMRYVRLDKGIPFWMPDSLGVGEDATPEAIDLLNDELDVENLSTQQKQDITRAVFEQVFDEAHDNYKVLLKLWGTELEANFTAKKKLTSMFRRIIPMGISTGGVWTFNLRALRHVLALRGSEHAEEEIRLVARLMYNEIIEYEPNVFGDFNPETLEPEYKKV